MAIAGPKAPTPPTPPSKPSVDGADNSNSVPAADHSQVQPQEGNPNYGIHITLGNHGITISPGQTDSSEGASTSEGSEVPQKNIGSAEKTIVNKNQEQQPSDAERILGSDALQLPAANTEAQVQQNTDNVPQAQPSIIDISYWPFIIVFAAAFISFFIINMTKKSGTADAKRSTKKSSGKAASTDIREDNYNAKVSAGTRTDSREYASENAESRAADREIKEERPRFEVRI